MTRMSENPATLPEKIEHALPRTTPAKAGWWRGLVLALVSALLIALADWLSVTVPGGDAAMIALVVLLVRAAEGRIQQYVKGT